LSKKRWHLVCYDVRDPKRLAKVAKTVKGYGDRVQLSVFRCRLSRRQKEELRLELTKVMKDEDDLLIVEICPACAMRVVAGGSGGKEGWEPPPTFEVF